MILDLIFFAIVTVFVLIKLYKALGNKDYDPDPSVQERTIVSLDEFAKAKKQGSSDTMHNLNEEKQEEFQKQQIEKYGKTLSKKIDKITVVDKGFSIEGFLDGSKSAFEMVVGAFSKGDKERLESLVSSSIYKGLVSELNKRDDDEMHESTLVAIEDPEIEDISVDKKQANIVLKFVTQQINLVRDKSGKIIEGDASKIDTITDKWTFSRQLNSSDPNWKLIATQAG